MAPSIPTRRSTTRSARTNSTSSRRAATAASRRACLRNTADGKVGYVTRFAVRSDFIEKYDVHIVGSRVHAEYWIPAEELEAFNDAAQSR